MADPTKVQELIDIGTITTGDKLVGERVDGTTARIDYAVDVTLDAAPVLGGNLGYGGYSIIDNSSNELLKFSPAASAVNELTIANAATANYPVISATGGDAAIGLGLTTKSTGQFVLSSQNTSPCVFSSGTSAQHTTIFAMPNTAASRTVTWPDASGTVCYDTGSANVTTLGTVTTGTWNATIVGMQYGGTGANLTASNGGIVYTNASTMVVLAGTATANKMLLSGSSTTPSWSTSTIPTSAGATANKVLLSDGTNYTLSTPTFPNASATALKHIRSDGTNWIASTATISDTPGTAGKMMVSDGTNWITSTPTFPNSSVTANKIMRSDGTNWVASATTWPDTYTTNAIVYATGANTISAIIPAASSVLTSNGSNVPSWSTTLPAVSLANCTGLPISTGVSGLATGVASFLATPSSANLITAVTDETGTGSLVFANTPTLVTPVLGAATATSVSFSSTTGIIGTTTNNNAATGSVGELLATAFTTTGGLTSSVAANIVSLAITAGDWLVWGFVSTNPQPTTTTSFAVAALNTASGTVPAATSLATACFWGIGTAAAGVNMGGSLAPIRLSLSGTTTYYLNATVGFAVSTMTISGVIYARRLR